MIKEAFLRLTDNKVVRIKWITDCTMEMGINGEVKGVLSFTDWTVLEDNQVNIVDIVSFEEFVGLLEDQNESI